MTAVGVGYATNRVMAYDAPMCTAGLAPRPPWARQDGPEQALRLAGNTAANRSRSHAPPAPIDPVPAPPGLTITAGRHQDHAEGVHSERAAEGARQGAWCGALLVLARLIGGCSVKGHGLAWCPNGRATPRPHCHVPRPACMLWRRCGWTLHVSNVAYPCLHVHPTPAAARTAPAPALRLRLTLHLQRGGGAGNLAEIVEDKDALEEINKKREVAIQKADEKVAIAAQTYDLVDSHIR